MAHAHISTNPAPTARVLATLAHLGCGTLAQLHALCFPQAGAATVRRALIGLVEAGLITHAHWRLSHGERAQIWTITTTGLHRLRQELPGVATVHAPDLTRPSTPRETDEWQVRIDVRTLVVQLIREARQQAVCAHVSITTAPISPVPMTPDGPPQPDAIITIAWEPPTVQAADWLPWLTAPGQQPVTRYALYAERLGHPRTFARWIAHCTSVTQDTVLLMLATPERAADVTRLLQAQAPSQPIRLCSWDNLAAGFLHAPWRDGSGAPCAIRPKQQTNKT
jgi:hypothetical protein